MSDREKQFLALYRACRHKDQVSFYRSRVEEFEKARDQAIYVAAALMILTAVTSTPHLTAGLIEPKWASVLGVLFPALSAALTAYNSLYSFDAQSKLYRDAMNALLAAEAIGYDAERENGPEAEVKIAAYVNQVEEISRKEVGQWGQLISEIRSSARETGADKGD